MIGCSEVRPHDVTAKPEIIVFIPKSEVQHKNRLICQPVVRSAAKTLAIPDCGDVETVSSSAINTSAVEV